jgi:hypothetical protein
MSYGCNDKRETNCSPYGPIKFVKKLLAEAFKLVVVPGDCIVQLLLG